MTTKRRSLSFALKIKDLVELSTATSTTNIVQAFGVVQCLRVVALISLARIVHQGHGLGRRKRDRSGVANWDRVGGRDNSMVDTTGCLGQALVVIDVVVVVRGQVIHVHIVGHSGAVTIDPMPPIAHARGLVEECAVAAQERIVTTIGLAVVPCLHGGGGGGGQDRND